MISDRIYYHPHGCIRRSWNTLSVYWGSLPQGYNQLLSIPLTCVHVDGIKENFDAANYACKPAQSQQCSREGARRQPTLVILKFHRQRKPGNRPEIRSQTCRMTRERSSDKNKHSKTRIQFWGSILTGRARHEKQSRWNFRYKWKSK